MVKKFDLGLAFEAKQKLMLAGLGLMPSFTQHPTAKGDATEDRWIEVLREFLPLRYGVGQVFAIDSLNNQSEQIDIAIFDQHYSPLFFEQGGLRFVPVESIYAVFEVKPTLDKSYIEYARNKVASVRKLHRTSTEIYHAGGVYAPQDPSTKRILGGILATSSTWAGLGSNAARNAILGGSDIDQLEFVIAVRDGAVERVADNLEHAPEGQQLIWFAMRLFRRLAANGTVLALDLAKYGRYIELLPGVDDGADNDS